MDFSGDHSSVIITSKLNWSKVTHREEDTYLSHLKPRWSIYVWEFDPSSFSCSLYCLLLNSLDLFLNNFLESSIFLEWWWWLYSVSVCAISASTFSELNFHTESLQHKILLFDLIIIIIFIKCKLYWVVQKKVYNVI